MTASDNNGMRYEDEGVCVCERPCSYDAFAQETSVADARPGLLADVRAFVNDLVDSEFDAMWEVSEDIHAHPQIAFEEKYASELCRTVMAQHGFEVADVCPKLPTSFGATFARGVPAGDAPGAGAAVPRIALFAEYDALPEMGHACGHNLIATSAMLGGIAAKAAMEKFGIAGSIEVYGTPAEEDGGGKIIMLNEGAFDGVDAVYLMHPTSAMTRIGGGCTSFSGTYVRFTGKPAHAESHPEDGVNAMDAASLFHQAIGVARQQLPDEVHICDVIQSISHDIGRIPHEAFLEVEVSSTVGSHIAPALEVVERCARGVAMATGCEVEIEQLGGYLGRVPNGVLGDVARAELEAFGEPVMDGMPGDKGGEDLGDVSRVIPAVNIFGTILPERKISGHTDEFRELALSDNARHCLRVTAKALATSAIALMLNPGLLDDAKAELKERLAQER